ncbi:sulfite exporter TauE/SafE family protein [Aestuariicoccus sp. MJ-SS9]|uniref:sulfite exporter TauE/SafE family protein n=1 Tax=Aestuariicoccus sp. MJ-SS9 TaxID=3079855 RepID=UPI002912B2A6|nr:sulfite exporter TauE/SafE family protein [Aestuariicoccus sp. MJ-SS9]MDU8911857.1 sulfite exporter TauE/SafE family protein [Aestuariicoccus sp. MJ-SS9]
MELLTWSVFAMAVPAVIFAGISKGGFGSGVAFASASILALVLEPAVAMGLMLPLLMLIDVASLPAYWRKWDWSVARVLLAGAVPGTFIGALFWASADADMIRLIIGAVALLFVTWQAAQALGLIRLGARFGARTGLVAGGVLGFTSFVSHAGGPAAAVYMLGQGLSKTAYQSTTVLVFWAVNLFKSGFYAGMGIFTRETLLLDLALIPFALLGTWLGIKAHRMVPEKLFFSITYTALTITGTKLIWDALT